MIKQDKRLSLHPLGFEEALADLLRVQPAEAKKKPAKKTKATRRKGKKGSKRERDA